MSVEKSAVARINRALAINSLNAVRVKTTRNQHEKQALGRFLLIDIRKNTILDASNDIAVFPAWEERISDEYFDECLAEVAKVLKAA